MGSLGTGLFAADHREDALSVYEANLSILRRVGADEETMLNVQGNLACTYHMLGRLEEAKNMRRDCYSGWLKLKGAEHPSTLFAANFYATLLDVVEAKALLCKIIPVARRVLGDSDDLTLKMRWVYSQALYGDPGASLDDLREAVTTLEDTARIARRVLGGEHPLTAGVEKALGKSRAAYDTRRGVLEALAGGHGVDLATLRQTYRA